MSVSRPSSSEAGKGRKLSRKGAGRGAEASLGWKKGTWWWKIVFFSDFPLHSSAQIFFCSFLGRCELCQGSVRSVKEEEEKKKRSKGEGKRVGCSVREENY